MLSDDIASGAKWIANRTGRFLRGALQGALLFGAIGLAGGTLAWGGYALWNAGAAAVFSNGILSGVGRMLFTFAHAIPYGVPYAAVGAIGGAVATAVASVLPGVRKPPEPAPDARVAASEAALCQAISQNPNRAQHYGNFDNPDAQAGMGAKLAARGAALETAQTR